MIGAKISGGDKAKEAIAAMRKRVQQGNGASVRVGVPDNVNEEDGTSVAFIAAVHEFGAPGHGIEPRPFLAPSIIKAKREIAARNKADLVNVANGRLTVFTALERLGAFAAGKVQQYIRNGTFAALSEATIRRKGSSKPLIDTGNLIQSINYEVRKK